MMQNLSTSRPITANLPSKYSPPSPEHLSNVTSNTYLVSAPFQRTWIICLPGFQIGLVYAGSKCHFFPLPMDSLDFKHHSISISRQTYMLAKKMTRLYFCSVGFVSTPSCPL